jgi:hypothetical protein
MTARDTQDLRVQPVLPLNEVSDDERAVSERRNEKKKAIKLLPVTLQQI